VSSFSGEASPRLSLGLSWNVFVALAAGYCSVGGPILPLAFPTLLFAAGEQPEVSLVNEVMQPGVIKL